MSLLKRCDIYEVPSYLSSTADIGERPDIVTATVAASATRRLFKISDIASLDSLSITLLC